MPTLEARFWAKVEKRGPDECWLWTASCMQKGYGMLFSGRGKAPHRSHRIAWELQRGPIPPGQHVLHRCDVRACVNPDHLFLGTNTDNMRDRDEKGRTARGESLPQHKLTGEQVRRIRELRARYPRLKQSTLAREYGVHPSAISRAVTGRRWKHL